MTSKRWKTPLGLLIVFTVMVSLFVTPGTAMADDDTAIARGGILDFDGDLTEWIETEADTPTGSEYRLFDVWGGFWADAEKDPDPGDDLLCWAATASNMMEWTGWGFVGGMEDENTDDFFQFFRNHVTDGGHFVDAAIDWWFDGTLRAETGAATETVDHTGFWVPPYVTDTYTWIFDDWSKPDVLSNIGNQLLAGRPVGLSIYSDGGGAHAVTCWGFNYDTNYGPGDTEYYKGVWLSDSDSHKDQWNPPDVLRYYAVQWDSGDGRWEMPNYGGGWYIWGVTSLEMFPGSTRPTADAGAAYTGNEGSPITFNASGSTDDSALRYRWDFDEDGVWDTGWLTSATATNTWDDNYTTGTVYLEVFDERLRDMDITTITVNNVAPTVTATGDTIDENGTATVSGTISDPGILDTFTVKIDWGEGDPQSYSYPAGSTTFSETYQYLDDNPTGTPSDAYAINVEVTDKDGGVGTATTTVTVNNVAPVVEAPSISNQPNPEFILSVVHEVDFEGAFSDVGTQDTHTAVWDWGDSSTSAGTVTEIGGSGTVTESHTYSVPGDYTITLTVTDDDTGVHYNTMVIHVADVAEALDITNAYIQGLDDEDFKDKADNRKNAFDNVFSALHDMLADEEYRGMIQNMRSNIKEKADGVGKNDWIIDATAQAHICQKVDDITQYLEYLLNN